MQKKLSRRPAAKPLPASSPPFYPPFDRENDALRFPALLSPRMKSLNGIWMMDTRRAKPGESFFTPDFEAHNWQGVPIPCSATPDVHMLRLLREFELDSSWLKKENGTILLRFEGAGPALSVWINGVFIGCVKTKNDFAEFDITGRVQNGINRIAVLLRRTGKDESAFLKIDQGVHLILQPRIGFQTADVRLDSRKITLGLTVRNSSERDQMLDLSVKLLDRNNVVRPGRMIFRGLAVKAQSGTAFSLAEPFRRFWPGLKKQSISAALLTLSAPSMPSGDSRRIALCETGKSIPLPLVDPSDSAEDFSIRGPRRNPVSQEDDGEDLWISSTSGLLACFGREAGTVESLDLDGVSLMDRGPLPAGHVSWADITLDRKNGQAELESLAPGVRLRWCFLRTGRIRFTAELSPKKGKEGLVMHLSPHLDRLFHDSEKGPCSLPRDKAEIRLKGVRGLVFSGDLKAGLAILFRESADVIWQRHRHTEECHHHDCGCGKSSELGGTELILKTQERATLFRYDFLMIPFAPNTFPFDNLFLHGIEL